MYKLSKINCKFSHREKVNNGLKILSKAFKNRSNYADFLSKHTEITRKIDRKGFVFQIYPDDSQKNFIHKNIGCRRKLFNFYVKSLYNYLENTSFQKGFISTKNLFAELPSVKTIKDFPEFSYFKDVDSLALCNAWLDFKDSVKKYNNFFVSKKGNPFKKHALKQVKTIQKPLCFKDLKGLPRFSAKWFSTQSYSTNNQKGTVSFCGNSLQGVLNKRFDYLKIPKLKTPLKVRKHRNLPENGVIKKCTITRKNDQYFVTLLLETAVFQRKLKKSKDTTLKLREILRNNSNLVLGLDYSQQNGCVGSDSIANDLIVFEKIYRKNEQKLAALQRMKAKKQQPNRNDKQVFFGSKNYQKLKVKIAKVQEKIRNYRKNALHVLSKRLVEKYFLIAVEDINLQSLSQVLKLAKNLLDNGFGIFRQNLQYKLENESKIFHKVEKFYPSSQICHVCGTKNPITKDLKIRKFECSNCHEKLDRDENAAKNIQKHAIETFVLA